MTTNELTDNKINCSGCGLCSKICPKKAILMIKDDYGFIYPSINESLCINCKLCKKKCSYQSESLSHFPSKCYIASSKDENIIKKSASGGIFSTLAKAIINLNGVVYGCSLELEHDLLVAKHIRINNYDDLIKLQGSKYVQSNIFDSYEQVKNDLLSGKTVLYSGTPCQIAALYKYVESFDFSHLYTIDLICHGVPSNSFFQGYISCLEEKYNCKLKNICFRDKKKGWNVKGYIEYKKGKKIKYKGLYANLSSYYNMFLNSKINRLNCYNCKYATNKRIGDITIGDYWGANEEHKEIMSSNKYINEKRGVSCILINTEKGKKLMSMSSNNIEFYESNFEKISHHNQQLIAPNNMPKNRETILEDFKTGGYSYVENKYMHKLGIKKYIYPIWNLIPNKFQELLKRRSKK